MNQIRKFNHDDHRTGSTRARSGRALLLSSIIVGTTLAACGPEQPAGQTEEQNQPIVGGTATFARPEVVSYTSPPVNVNCKNTTGPLIADGCTAELIAPRYLITAAHCVNYQAGPTGGSISMTNTAGAPVAGSPFAVSQTFAFSRVGTNNNCSGVNLNMSEADVALVRLVNPINVAGVVPAMISSLQPASGAAVTKMGYGCTSRNGGDGGAPAGGGFKQSLGFNWPNSNTNCPGDSGGPVFFNGNQQIFRVNSATGDQYGDVVLARERIEATIRTLEGGKEPGIDRPGFDISNFNSGTVQGCMTRCNRTDGCAAFTFVTATQQCFLKRAVAAAVPNAGVISGFPNRHNNYDRPGSDITSFLSASDDTCEAEAARDASTKSWTFFNGRCFLKGSVPAISDSCSGCVSGDIRGQEPSTDRPGSDVASFIIDRGNPKLCSFECAKRDDCRSWTWVDDSVRQFGTCFLKNVVAPAVASNSRITSGVRRGLEINIDRPGNDIRNFTLARPLPELCQAACAQEPNGACKAWTMEMSGRCWLKNAVPPQVFNLGMVSGRRGMESF
jgi:hypothetical protein